MASCCIHPRFVAIFHHPFVNSFSPHWSLPLTFYTTQKENGVEVPVLNEGLYAALCGAAVSSIAAVACAIHKAYVSSVGSDHCMSPMFAAGSRYFAVLGILIAGLLAFAMNESTDAPLSYYTLRYVPFIVIALWLGSAQETRYKLRKSEELYRKEKRAF